LKSVKLFGKERDMVTLIAGVIIVYFWVLVPFLHAPAILSEYVTLRIPLIALGVIVVKVFGNDESLLKARYKTKKLVTSFGVFEWDGSMREVQSGSQKFYVFYEGINANGIYRRGDKVFICPVDMAKKAGHNWLLKADLSVNTAIPTVLEPYKAGVSYCLYGNTPSADFGEVCIRIQEIKSRMELQDETIKRQRMLLAESLKMLSDKHAVKNLGSDKVVDEIEKALRGNQS